MVGKQYEWYNPASDRVCFIVKLNTDCFELMDIIRALQFYTTKKGLSYESIKNTVELVEQLTTIAKEEPKKIEHLSEARI